MSRDTLALVRYTVPAHTTSPLILTSCTFSFFLRCRKPPNLTLSMPLSVRRHLPYLHCDSLRCALRLCINHGSAQFPLNRCSFFCYVCINIFLKFWFIGNTSVERQLHTRFGLKTTSRQQRPCSRSRDRR